MDFFEAEGDSGLTKSEQLCLDEAITANNKKKKATSLRRT